MKAISQTLDENQDKFIKLKQAHQVITQRLQKSEKDVKDLKVQHTLCNKQQAQIQSIKQLSEHRAIIDDRIAHEQEKLNTINKAKDKLDQDYQQINQKVLENKNKASTILSVLDPLNVNVDSNPYKDDDKHRFGQNDAVNAENNENTNENSQSHKSNVNTPQVLEDEHLRKVLDDIDIKIGQSIEDKEKDNKKLRLLQRQLQEAKDSFTYAYKHLK